MIRRHGGMRKAVAVGGRIPALKIEDVAWGGVVIGLDIVHQEHALGGLEGVGQVIPCRGR